ncbi:AcrR family transcriptional regulator [Thermocatellispora tengchongensis]|uniref:AcrR family transcriptional regulator n=1 Tax=Thermocatellispora tengchongensis TaxID=1073253 RepID=A0A840PFM4_9ACTN|nr:TetR/AcrR family transcriptional regulator [Thermocatellispora tengchongensis]MBB5136641.1 AcrR family transcriptional regulator [Thermocatellispora tengchongensis]
MKDPAIVTRRPRRRLTARMIVEHAMRLVRDDGLQAVTMRRLADELGTAPMSLYRHIPDRQALMVAMLDQVARDIRFPPPAGDPRAEITAVLTAIHDALRRDSWAIGLIVTDKLAGPSIIPALERLFAALRRAGLTLRDTRVAFALLWHYTVGELLDTHLDIPDDTYARRMVHDVDPESYPTLAAIAQAAPGGPPGDWFAENLQRLLDGLLPRSPAADRPAAPGEVTAR